MLTMRAPRTAAEYYKQQDPNTAITEAFIRRLINNGDIPVVKNGVKQLVSIESIDEYLNQQLS